MGSLLPKTVVILGVIFFLLLVEPPTVSGLKCYTCGEVVADVARDADAPIANISNGAAIPSNIAFGSKGGKARAGEGDCKNKETTCSFLGVTEFVCSKTVTIITDTTVVVKSCAPKLGQELKCKKSEDKGDSLEHCYCDTDLCNGGRSLKEGFGFGLMSLTLGVISVFKLL